MDIKKLTLHADRWLEDSHVNISESHIDLIYDCAGEKT